MFKRTLAKSDGRALWLYSATAEPPELDAPSPPGARGGSGHLRWHPLRAEWVAYAAHRQHRTFLPPPEYNPLAPTTDPTVPTELPAGPYDIAVFENLFPTLSHDPAPPPESLLPTAPAAGACEVVVFTQDPQATLGTLPQWHLRLLFDVWADRTAALGARADVGYVMPFENRGVEVGVTLQHPHGQIYAYPFVPPVAERILRSQRAYLDANGSGLMADMVEAELRDGRRLVFANEHAVAFVPACARYPYEMWIVPRRQVATVPELTAAERDAMALALQTVVRTYDALWLAPFPYVMAVHQAPTDGEAHPEAHLHLEFYPAYRLKGRLKYQAGSELHAGVFTADAEPEAIASELQAARARLD